MSSQRIKELVCVVVLVVFVVCLSAGSSVSKKSASEVFDQIKSKTQIGEIKKCDKSKFKKETGFAENEFESVVYYGSDSVMEVREIIVVKLKDSSQSRTLVQSLEERVSKKAELFKGYAPEQSAMLDSFVLEEKGGFVFFAVGSEPQKLKSAFEKAL